MTWAFSSLTFLTDCLMAAVWLMQHWNVVTVLYEFSVKWTTSFFHLCRKSICYSTLLSKVFDYPFIYDIGWHEEQIERGTLSLMFLCDEFDTLAGVHFIDFTYTIHLHGHLNLALSYRKSMNFNLASLNPSYNTNFSFYEFSWLFILGQLLKRKHGIINGGKSIVMGRDEETFEACPWARYWTVYQLVSTAQGSNGWCFEMGRWGGFQSVWMFSCSCLCIIFVPSHAITYNIFKSPYLTIYNTRYAWTV